MQLIYNNVFATPSLLAQISLCNKVLSGICKIIE